MKKTLICGVALTFLCSLGLAGISLADNGPAEITLQSTVDPASKPKPAQFPHAKHQEKQKCGECHHGKAEDGKMTPYAEGMKIEKCESCHNKAAGMPQGLDTFKNVAHKKCKGCHKETGNKDLTKCSACHPKK